MERYIRQTILPEIGEEGQNKLSKAKVLVVGAGGLGCPILQYLGAAGVGKIGIIDSDVVELSNLQRQVLYGMESLGEKKVFIAKKFLQNLNPTLSVSVYPHRFTSNNALSLVDKYDVIADGSDNFSTRYLINDACVIKKKPFVYGGIHKFEGQVSVFNYQGGPSYRCLFPASAKSKEAPNCSEIGVLGILPGIIGAMQGNEILKVILGLSGILSGKLLCYDAKRGETNTFHFHRLASSFKKVLENKSVFNKTHKEKDFCKNKSSEILFEQAMKEENVRFVDVRNEGEEPKISLSKKIGIPLKHLEKKSKEKLNPEETIILYCSTGVRSKKGVKILKGIGFQNSYSIKGGIFSMIPHLKKIQ